MKRKLPAPPVVGGDHETVNEPIAKRSKVDETTDIAKDQESFSLDDHHNDILLNIALKVIEEYPLRPKCLNPFGYLNALSKRWNDLLDSRLVYDQLRRTPTAALHMLGKEKFQKIGMGQNYDLLQVAAPLFNHDERFKAMMSSADIPSLKLISKLPSFHIKNTRLYLKSRKLLNKQMSEAFPNFIAERREIFAGNGELQASDELLLFCVPLETILKRLFLDDLHVPNDYTWSFSLISKTICHIYLNDRRHLPKLIEWRDRIKGVDLPFTRFDVLCEAMIWPMTLAFLIEDWEFLTLLDISKESLKKDVRCTTSLSRNIFKCLKNRCSAFPSRTILHLEEICISQASNGFMGFDKDTVRLAFRNILPRFTKPGAIAAVEELILDH